MKNTYFTSGIICLFICFLSFSCTPKDERAYKKIRMYPTEYELLDFIKKYPNSSFTINAWERLNLIYDNKYNLAKTSGSIITLNEFAEAYSFTPQGEKAKIEVKEFVDKAYQSAKATNTVVAWKKFKEIVPESYSKDADKRIEMIYNSKYQRAKRINTIEGWEQYKQEVPANWVKDADEQITKIENSVWETDDKAWSEASRLGNINAYQKYLNMYPNGNYKAQAERKIIDLEVSEILSGDYGVLPSMTRSNYFMNNSSHSDVSILNRTNYSLTIRYSGADSKKVTIPPLHSTTVRIKNGVYRIAASVNASNVHNYAGVEILDGGDYSSEYYVTSSNSYY